MEAVQKNLVLERQFLICLNYGNLPAADIAGKASRRHHVRPCLKYTARSWSSVPVLIASAENERRFECFPGDVSVPSLHCWTLSGREGWRLAFPGSSTGELCSSTRKTTDNNFSCLTRSCSEAALVLPLHLGFGVFRQIRILFLQALGL